MQLVALRKRQCICAYLTKMTLSRCRVVVLLTFMQVHTRTIHCSLSVGVCNWPLGARCIYTLQGIWYRYHSRICPSRLISLFCLVHSTKEVFAHCVNYTAYLWLWICKARARRVTLAQRSCSAIWSTGACKIRCLILFETSKFQKQESLVSHLFSWVTGTPSL